MKYVLGFLLLTLSWQVNAQTNTEWDETIEKVRKKIRASKFKDAGVILERFDTNGIPDSSKKQVVYLKTALLNLSSNRMAALAQLKEACDEYPTDYNLHIVLANLYTNTGMNEKAREYIYKSMAMARDWTDTASAMFSLSAIHMNEGKWDSLLYINQAIVDRDTSWMFECYVNMSIVYIMQKKPRPGIALVEQVLDKHPKGNFVAFNNLGMLYTEAKEYNKAITVFEKAIAQEPEFPFPYSNLGFCYHKLKKYNRAIELYNKSIKLGPTNSWVYKNKALTYIDLGMKKEACEYLAESKRRGYETFYGQEVNELIKKYCDDE